MRIVSIDDVVEGGRRFVGVTLMSFLALSFGFLATVNAVNVDKKNNKITKIGNFTGFCYGPYREGQYPWGPYPTYQEIEEDITFLKLNTEAIRTYGLEGTLSNIPKICDEKNLDCYLGVWISNDTLANDNNISELIGIVNQNHSSLKGLVIGSEVLYRNDVPEAKLIEYIDRVRNSLSDSLTITPVITTGETWYEWTQHSNVADTVDIILLQVHPYWESITAENATNHVIDKWNIVRNTYPQFPREKVIIGETGWPTEGDAHGGAIPSEENQNLFLRNFLEATQDTIPYFWFEIYDEPWKETKGSVGPHWGLVYKDRTIKPLVADLFNIGVEENTIAEKDIALFYNYPNPFKTRTTIRYMLQQGGYVSLGLYNMAGQKITTLINEKQGPGDYKIIFDAQNSGLSSNGIYFLNLIIGSKTATSKMVFDN